MSKYALVIIGEQTARRLITDKFLPDVVKLVDIEPSAMRGQVIAHIEATLVTPIDKAVFEHQLNELMRRTDFVWWTVEKE